MNCQPPKIISIVKNFPGESGEDFVVGGGAERKMVKKYKNFVKLNSYKHKNRYLREWINNRFVTNFSENDLSSIKDFSLIWNVFENIVCDNNCSFNRLSERLIHQSVLTLPNLKIV